MKFVRNNIFSILTALAIIAASFINPSELGKIKVLRLPEADKIAHGVMYFVFTFTLFLENRRRLVKIWNYLLLAIIPVMFGLVIEILQPMVTASRSREIADGIFNLAGVVLAAFIWYLIQNRTKISEDNIP